ncbi:glycosyltransferase family 4 protein [Motilibacter aurantiacus]|uniref:glycosyltransferase family 4 protein n=1 Tax=Motilibacter aurantiacus TaxID=2714955 RepID=UPI00140B354E|nr:glycosyltransferase family 4 protein [Motilibacter aurantiacus]
MKLYVNARFLTQRVTGVQRYAIEISRALLRAGLQPTFLAPSSAPASELADELSVQRRGRLAGHPWEQFELPYLARDGMLVNLTNTGPVAVRRQVVTIHDAAVFTFPEAYSPVFRRWYQVMLPVLGRQARAVMTVSEFSRSQLLEHCRVPAAKVTVTSGGSQHVLGTEPDNEVLERHGLTGRPFVLAVSSQNPTKNFPRLAQALSQLDGSGFDIVIAGGTNSRIFNESTSLPDAVKQLGYVTDPELVALYRAAGCFVFPSLYEGFGLPLVEAMALGCPVVASDAGPMREIAGDAAVFVDPQSVESISAAIARVMADADLRESMSRRGRERSQRFDWDAAAGRLIEVIERVEQRGARPQPRR